MAGSRSPRDPYDDLALAACACCRAQVRLHQLRALRGAGCAPARRELDAAEEAARLAREEHQRLRRAVLGC